MDSSIESRRGMDPAGKYTRYQSQFETSLPDRTWPTREIDTAPAWCSVDLRDGNQALATPMSVAKKLRFYQMLVDIGFKQIEIGYPAASQPEHEFARTLIEDKLIPVGVKPQVLVAARGDLVRSTFESLRGAPETIVHVYNSTSKLQRDIVYKMSQDETIRRAIEATRLVRDLSDSTGTPVQYQYSPESFTGTEREFARDICNAVIDAWEPKPERKIIINLPATVEMSYPKVFADQIEWMSRNLKSRDSVIVSVHTHNDRGCAVAATEFGLMAGAERVEGTLFGNGERAGNADLVVLALNLYTQGIDPELCFRNLPEIRALYEECTGLSVPDRHPYAGDAAPIAFSGTHQVAIRKSLEYREASGDPRWNVAYLPIDFNDVGLSYTPIVINSQSGKNGTAFVLNSQFGLQIPKEMEGEVSAVVQRWCEQHGTSISPDTMMELFNREFVGRSGPIELHGYSNTSAFTGGQESHSDLTLRINGQVMQAHGLGNGPIDAAVNALANANHPLKVLSFSEHSLSAGSEASAIAYVQVECRGVSRFGVGVNTNSERASIEALISALNRTLKEGRQNL